jgi:sulfide:quinone oxidoreductase
VKLKNGQELRYDVLVLATGTNIHPEQVEGLLGDGWRQNVFDFYTLEGSTALSKALRSWKGGKLVVHVAEMPIKCPVAPLEFVFLADAFFREHGLRDNVEITYATPLPGAFTKPRASAVLGSMMEERGIKVEPEFTVMEVDESARVLRSFDEREVPYDLLVDIPTNMGAEFVGASGMGDELNYLPVNKNTLQSERWENVWAIGDAGNAPASKAGATAHFMLETLVENILRQIDGLEPLPNFDGHANCFIESGNGKALLIDFNYDVEPLEGMFPLPGIGPLPLLRESPINHWGKLMFRWAYWNILMRGGDMPIESQMSMAGKKP